MKTKKVERNSLNWRNIHIRVLRIQKKIYENSLNRNKQEVKKVQKIQNDQCNLCGFEIFNGRKNGS